MTDLPTPVRGRLHPLETIAMVVLTVGMTLLSFWHKSTCGGTIGDIARKACYSDVAALWGGRELGAHVFPYIHGSYTTDPPAVHGGTLEYPTLTGVFVWLTALPVDSTANFIVVTLIVFIPVAAVVTLLLARTAGRRAWIWCATPPLAIYALYNWDVLPVLMTVVGAALVLAGPRRWSPTLRVLLGAAAFGVGGALKLYPVMFVLPLALAVLVHPGVAGAARSAGARVLAALAPIGVAVGVVLLANVPFMVVNFAGWFSVFQFQAARVIDASTLSIWYWGFRPWSDDTGAHTQHLMGLAATASTAVAIIAVVVVSLALPRNGRPYPWMQTSFALLCVYMAFNKVDSLQYTLWLMPFFVLLRLRWGWIVAYLLADLAAFGGWYRWIYYSTLGRPSGSTWADQALSIGVWGRFALLLAMAVAVFGTEVVRRFPTLDAFAVQEPVIEGPGHGTAATPADGTGTDQLPADGTGPDGRASDGRSADGRAADGRAADDREVEPVSVGGRDPLDRDPAADGPHPTA